MIGWTRGSIVGTFHHVGKGHLGNCCPTCGRAYAKPRRSGGKPTQYELYEAAFLDAEQRRALSGAQLFAYYKRVAPIEDLLFIQAQASTSPELSAQIDALLDQTAKINRDQVHAIFDARRHELNAIAGEQPTIDEAAFWRLHSKPSLARRRRASARIQLHRMLGVTYRELD